MCVRERERERERESSEPTNTHSLSFLSEKRLQGLHKQFPWQPGGVWCGGHEEGCSQAVSCFVWFEIMKGRGGEILFNLSLSTAEYTRGVLGGAACLPDCLPDCSHGPGLMVEESYISLEALMFSHLQTMGC